MDFNPRELQVLKITCSPINPPYLIEVAWGLWESLLVGPFPFSFRLETLSFCEP